MSGMPLLDVFNESVLILCRRSDKHVRVVNCATSLFPSCLAFWPAWPWAETILTRNNFIRCQTEQVPISTKVDTATVRKDEIFVAKRMINCTIRLSKNVYSASALVALCSFATLRQVSLQVIRPFRCCLFNPHYRWIVCVFESNPAD